MFKSFTMLSTAVGAIVLTHSIQVWMWAASFLVLGALNTLETALYFSLLTYTTLGYGDITLGADFRLFGGFAAVTGLLTFGISTAFLVGLISRMFPKNSDVQ